MRIVIDTNALIDASSDAYHYASRIIDLVISGQVQAYANKSTLKENQFLSSKKISDDGYLKKLEYFFNAVLPVDSGERLQVVTDDPQDNKILESAVASKADYLITSDKHLLRLEKFRGTKIVRPNEFWSIYADEGEGWTRWLRDFIR